jgi:formate dehydrogenase subunit delta
MSSSQVERLVYMANQIALNMAAWGDQAVVAAKTRDHLSRFWTPAMREQLQAYREQGGEGLSPAVVEALDF